MYEYRVTKYNSALRDRFDSYTGDEWTTRRDIGDEIGGHVLTEDEYLETENKYLYALETFAHESGVRRLTVVGLDKPSATPAEFADLTEGASISVDRALDVVRHMLREGPLTARLEDDERFYVHVGYDMYMWIGSHVECADAVAQAERIGLFVDRDIISPLHPDPADRYWWLDEDAPVGHELVSYARDDGRTLERWPIADEKVPGLRQLFTPKPDDEKFYDAYEIADDQLERIGRILGMRLDPDLDYLLQTYSIE